MLYRSRREARNSQWGELYWGSGGEASSGRSLGAELPALENFAFENLRLKILQKIMLLKRGIKIGSATCRGSPRGHIFKSLASKPQVLKNCPVLGSRTALFFDWLKFCRSGEKCFFRPFFFEIDGKNFLRPFFRKTLAFVSLALTSSIPVLGLGFFLCPWPWPRALFPRLHLWQHDSTDCINRLCGRWLMITL